MPDIKTPTTAQRDEAHFTAHLTRQSLDALGWKIDELRFDATGMRLIAHRPYTTTTYLSRPGFGEIEE